MWKLINEKFPELKGENRKIVVIATAAETFGHCFNHDDRDSVPTAVAAVCLQQQQQQQKQIAPNPT